MPITYSITCDRCHVLLIVTGEGDYPTSWTAISTLAGKRYDVCKACATLYETYLALWLDSSVKTAKP